ncbi:MAG: TetR/AcrR family transcriptional regulator [Hyphomonadaceae bacterium]
MAANPAPSKLAPQELSPNQLAKRQAIVRAAAQLMSNQGVHACTSRAISQASGFSTSALHYYFRDIDEIFDLAIRSVIDRFLSNMQNAADAEADSIDALWAACTAYFQHGSDWRDGKKQRARAPMVWFEYQAESLRKNDLDTVRELSQRGLEFIERLVIAAGLPRPEMTAHALYLALIGAVVRDNLFHRDVTIVLGELSAALSIPPSAKYCDLKAARPR